MPDDDLARAVINGRGRQDIERMLERTGRFGAAGSAELAKHATLVERAQRAGSATAVNSAMAIGLAQSGTGYATTADMLETIIQAADGDTALEGDLLATARSASERARRPDLAAPGHVTQAQELNRVRATLGGDPTAHANTRAGVNGRMRAEALSQAGAHAILNGRPSQAVQAAMVQLGSDYDAAVAAGDIEQATELASQITSFRNAMGSAPPAARQHVMAMLEHVGVDPGAVNPQTGAAYSVDEQLGTQLARLAVATHGNSPVAPTTQDLERIRQEATQNIRTRAGLYDAGGGDRTPQQLRAMQPPDETGN